MKARHKYICKRCGKSVDEMENAILVKVVSPPTHCTPNPENKKHCPCITGETCIWHLGGDHDYYETHFHFTKGMFTKEGFDHCSSVHLEHVKPLTKKDRKKLVIYSL